MDVAQVIPIVRSGIGHSAAKVFTSDIINAISVATGVYTGRMQNTAQRWYPGEIKIKPPVGKSTFNQAIAGYSKALSVEWVNPLKPNERGIEIPIVQWQDMNFEESDWIDRDQPITQSSGSDNYPRDIIEAIAFQGFGASLQIRVAPTPNREWTYRLYYDQQVQPLRGVNDLINLPDQWWYLVATNAQRTVLPLCGYPEGDRQGYEAAIRANIRDAENNFDKWIGSTHVQDTFVVDPYMPGGYGG